IEPGICVFGSSPMLAVMFENLVENAVKYASDAKVVLELSSAEDEFRFRLRNGVGRPASDLPESYKLGRALVGIIANRHGFALVQPPAAPDAFEIVVTGPLCLHDSSLERMPAPRETDLRAM